MILCSCTGRASDTNHCPRPASVLLTVPEKPAAPDSNKPNEVLSHSVKYGEWCQKLEQQLMLLGDFHNDNARRINDP